MKAWPTLVVLPSILASAAAQLPAPTLTNRAAPRATWTAVTSAGTTTPTGTPPAVPNVNTTFRTADACGAASSDKIWVFGGSLGNNTSTTTNDLWAFDALAGTFTQVLAHGTAGAPAARGRHSVAWNPSTSRLVVFGGNTRGATPTLLNDTWEFDPATTTWTNVVTPTTPSPRQFASMAYCPTLGGILLFGGQTNDAAPNVNSNETWLLLGGTWNQLTPATAPAARGQHSMVTRSDFGDVLLCGGLDNGIATPEQIRFLDVWTWNGSTWSMISNCDVLTNPTGTGTTWPGNVNANQAVYDPLRQRVVLQGGQGITVAANATYVYGPNYGGSPSNFTSEFDCLTNQWVLYSTGTGTTPFNNSDPQIGRISRYFGGFVATTGKVYKICGQNAAGSSSKPAYNVYAYQANPVASTASYGAGCNGSGGPMVLTADNQPWTGRTFSATSTGFGPLSLCLGVVGLTQISVPMIAVLPQGGLGCDVLANPDLLLTVLPAAGSAQITFPLPNTPSLGGVPLYFQAAELAFDLGGNIVGLSGSNGVAATIGAL